MPNGNRKRTKAHQDHGSGKISWLSLFLHYLLLSGSALAQNTAEIQDARRRLLEDRYLKGSGDDPGRVLERKFHESSVDHSVSIVYTLSNGGERSVKIPPGMYDRTGWYCQADSSLKTETNCLIMQAYDLVKSGQIEETQDICEQILKINRSVTDVQQAVAIYCKTAEISDDFTNKEKTWNFAERALNLYPEDSIIGTQHFSISIEYHFLNARKQISNNNFEAAVKSFAIMEEKLNLLSGDDFNYFSSEFSNVRLLYHAAQYEAKGELERKDVEQIYEDCKKVLEVNYDIEQVENAVGIFSKVRSFFKPSDILAFFDKALLKQPNSSLIYIRYVEILAELNYTKKSLEMAQAGILSYVNEKDLDHKKRIKPYIVGFCEGLGLSEYCRKNKLSIENLSEKIVSQYFGNLLDPLKRGQSIQQKIEFPKQGVESHMPSKEPEGDTHVIPNEKQESSSVIKVIIAAVISGFAFLLWRFVRGNERVALPMVRQPRIRSQDSTTSESYEVSPELYLNDLRNQWETLKQQVELQLNDNFIVRIKCFDFKLMDCNEIVRIAERAIWYRGDDCSDITSRLQRSLDILLQLIAGWSKRCSVEVAQEKYTALQEAYQLLSELEFSVKNIEQIEGRFSRLKEISNDYSSYKRDGEYALTEGPKLLAKLSKVRNSIGQKLDELERLADQETVRNRTPLPFFNGENRQVNDNNVQPCGDIPRFGR